MRDSSKVLHSEPTQRLNDTDAADPEVTENTTERPADVLKVRGRTLFAAGMFGGGFSLEDGKHFGSGL